jgi:hypothetical protein
MSTVDIIKLFFPFVLLWVVYLAVVILLWIKSEIISVKIIGNNDIENINLLLDYKKIMSIGIILLGLYFIIETLPKLFSYISNYIIFKTRFVDRSFPKEYTIKEIIEIISIIIKITTSFIIIKYRKKIIDFLDKTENVE